MKLPRPPLGGAQTPGAERRYKPEQRAAIATALGWSARDARLPDVVSELERATVYLPLHRHGRQGQVLRKIARTATRLLGQLGDLDAENRVAIGANAEAEAVIGKIKNRALTEAPKRGRPPTRAELRPFIELAARVYEQAVGKRATCSPSRRTGRFAGQFFDFLQATLQPFLPIHSESLGRTAAETLRAIRQQEANRAKRSK